jgi:hypothetical protein
MFGMRTRSPSFRTLHAGQGSHQGYGNGAQRYAKDFGDFPVAKAFGPQPEATLILFRESAENNTKARSLLVEYHLFLGTRSLIKRCIRHFSAPLPPSSSFLVGKPPLQRQIVRHPKNPAPQVSAIAPQLQVPEQRKKNLLEDVFAVIRRQTERESVPENRLA